MFLLIVAGALNMGFAIYGAVYQPESFPNHLLFVLLGNLALYLVYYIAMKIFHCERFTGSAIIHLLSGVAFWVAALYFFYQEVKSYEVQPAISRTRNRPCIVLQTYDVHDVWHLLSSFGLFFFFMTLLTIDDGVRNQLRTELAAF